MREIIFLQRLSGWQRNISRTMRERCIWKQSDVSLPISAEELEKCRYNYKGKDTYAFVMSDRYIMALYTYCLSARKAVILENIEMEGLSEAELSMVKLESVREVLFQALLLDDVKFEDGKMYAELSSIYLLC